MKTLRRVALALAAGAMGLALGGAAAGSTSKSRPKVRHIQGRIEALALDGSRIAYDVGPQGVANKVLVWNVSTGKTTTVSGKHTRSADDSSTGSGVIQLAIAGSRVAWLVNVGGNTEGDDYLYSSSVTKPKERQVATEQRLGESCPGRSQTNCAGQWLGGLVASGNLIALNRWTTDAAGSVIDGGLYVLSGTTMKTVANGGITVEAASADGGRVAVLHPGIGVVVYSSAGMFLLTVSVPKLFPVIPIPEQLPTMRPLMVLLLATVMPSPEELVVVGAAPAVKSVMLLATKLTPWPSSCCPLSSAKLPLIDGFPPMSEKT